MLQCVMYITVYYSVLQYITIIILQRI